MQYTRDSLTGPDREVGEWTYGNPTLVSFKAGESLKIGKFCSISDGVKLMFGGDHDISRVSTYPLSFFLPEGGGRLEHIKLRGDLVIGNDVWIGTDALIFAGVTIGNGAVIGARSLVNKDVAPYEVVGGVPAKHIKFRFPPDVIRKLEDIAWWNWPLKELYKALPLMLDINAFIDAYYQGVGG